MELALILGGVGLVTGAVMFGSWVRSNEEAIRRLETKVSLLEQAGPIPKGTDRTGGDG